MVLPIGKKSARDLDRYLRLRAAHPRAELPWLWLGPKGRLTPSGIYQMIKDRGRAIDLPELHPHQLRHTFSHDWQVGRIASDATFPGKRDHDAVGDAARACRRVLRAHGLKAAGQGGM